MRAACLLAAGVTLSAMLFQSSVAGAVAPTVSAARFSHHGNLAFVSRGALYVIDGADAADTRVVARGASAPQFSPNGRWLAFSVAGGVAVTSATGDRMRVLALHGGTWAWLPGGDLLAGGSIEAIGHGGAPVRVGSAPKGLFAWDRGGHRYVFVVRSRVVEPGGAFRGAERIEVASSLRGQRTTWYSSPIAFTPTGGFSGNSIARILVLPRSQGLLVWLDPDQSASLAADGLEVDDLARVGAPLRPVAVTVGDTVSVADDGALGIGAGPGRSAWATKHILSCPSVLRCSVVPTPPGTIGIDPTIAPDGAKLAFVEAAAEASGEFEQRTVVRWYATHHLFMTTRGTHRVEVPGSVGAADPVWSADGRSLVFVADDFLELIGHIGERPVRIAGPLLAPANWDSYFGQVDWAEDFSWSMAAARP